MIRSNTRLHQWAAFSLLILVCLAAGTRPNVLEIGQSGPHVWVREGEVVTLHYTQSMYDVPVEERLRVEAGRLVLFEVVSSEAALEYLGIENKGLNNTMRILQEFSILADSVGNYVLCTSNRSLPLASVPADNGRILVRLTRPPLFIHLIHTLREL